MSGDGKRTFVSVSHSNTYKSDFQLSSQRERSHSIGRESHRTIHEVTDNKMGPVLAKTPIIRSGRQHEHPHHNGRKHVPTDGATAQGATGQFDNRSNITRGEKVSTIPTVVKHDSLPKFIRDTL